MPATPPGPGYLKPEIFRQPNGNWEADVLAAGLQNTDALAFIVALHTIIAIAIRDGDTVPIPGIGRFEGFNPTRAAWYEDWLGETHGRRWDRQARLIPAKQIRHAIRGF